MGVLDQWEMDRTVSHASVSGTHADHLLKMLIIQSSCYCYEQAIYCNVIAGILEVFDVHGPKMLRNRKKIKGSYFYNLCEMLREPENVAAVATFTMVVSIGKRPQTISMGNPWGTEITRPTPLSLWTLFYDILAISDEELEETILSWTRTAQEWSLAMIHLKLAHKKLLQEAPLYLTGKDIYESDDDREKVQTFVQECLRAGDDRDALSKDDMVKLRGEVRQIQLQMDLKVNNSKGIKQLTPYDIDLLKFNVVALGQICNTGNLVHALVIWKTRRQESMEMFRTLAMDKWQRAVAVRIRGFKDLKSYGFIRFDITNCRN
ncbi:hypothetical protein ABW20_dc0106803 [Dactylellina cionopaga]|nr:hypothetical protein ABW20_dc0106803 [Dactylellina cionopaga]